jgi:2-C-methyl-D-erythritol 4-phosphate cytidylyltransferase
MNGPTTEVAAVLLAGGRGSRAHRDTNKLYLPIGERVMLEFAWETMMRSPDVDRIVLVVRDEDASLAEDLLSEITPTKPAEVVVGGATRHESEFHGLEALAPDIESGKIGLVAIHDGARPFLTLELLHTLVATARENGGAIPGLTLDEPTYRVTDSGVEQLPHESLRRVQTPQVFNALPLLEAYRRAAADGFEGVDTAETVERYSDLDVSIIPGDARNIKVTFVEDFFLAEEYALAWDKGVWQAG